MKLLFFQKLTKKERPTYLKTLFLTVLAFSIPVAIQMRFVLEKGTDDLRFILIPFLVSLLVGHLLARNTILKIRLKASNEAKSEFLARVSHDLRTPLHAINGFSELLTNSPQEPLTPNQQDSVQEIRNATQILMELINDLLDLSSMEANTLALSVETLQPYMTTRECVSLISTLATAKYISIEIESDQENIDTHIQADSVRLKQILLNLLSNAIKFSPEHSIIHISHTLTDNNMVRITIRDQGSGLTDEQKKLIFIPFNRLSISNHKDIEGHGLGLAICKRLTHLMHGNIGCTSQLEHGSAFWVEFKQTP